MTGKVESIEIVLPAHNEAASIGATLEEFLRVSDAAGLKVRNERSDLFPHGLYIGVKR